MASLTPGYTFATNERLTAAKLHQLVDSAYIVNVSNPEQAAGHKLVYITTPGSPAAGDVRIGSDGLLEFFFSSAWNDHPANELTLSLTNKSGSDLVTGDVVVVDHANSASFTIASTNPAADVIGVLAADIANNAAGLVYVRGVVQVRVAAAAGVAAGSRLTGPNGTSGTAAIKVAAQLQASPRSNGFAILLEGAGPAQTDLATCFIWQ